MRFPWPWRRKAKRVKTPMDQTIDDACRKANEEYREYLRGKRDLYETLKEAPPGTAIPVRCSKGENEDDGEE